MTFYHPLTAQEASKGPKRHDSIFTVLNFAFCNFHTVTCAQKSALFKSIFHAGSIALVLFSKCYSTLSYILSKCSNFFSGIDSTLLEIFKNLWDLSKKWMQTPEAGDHHHHGGDPVSQFLRSCTSWMRSSYKIRAYPYYYIPLILHLQVGINSIYISPSTTEPW